jgi:glutamine synthetase type III
MTLKWMAVMVAVVSATLCVTANVVVAMVNGNELPVVVNMLALTAAGSATVLAVVADLHYRLNGRITALTEFLVARLNEIEAHAGDRNAGFVEGYLLNHSQDAAVVPIGPRTHGRRAMIGGDD